MKIPPYLKKGDTIGIVAPAGYMAAEKMQAWTIAKDFLKQPDPAAYYEYPEDLNLPWITKPLK